MSLGIIVKDYNHYNRAMGKQITSKAHYEKEMVKGGYIPFEESEKIVAQKQRESRRDYKPDKKLLALIQTIKTDKKGHAQLSDRARDELKRR